MTYNSRFAKYVTRFLRVIYWFIVLIFVVVFFLLIAAPETGAEEFTHYFEVALEVAGDAYTLSAPDLGLDTIELSHVSTDLSLMGASLPLWFEIISWAFTLVVAAAFVYALRLLLRLFSSIAEGDPFQAKNLYRLRAIGWLSIGGYLLFWLRDIVTAVFLSRHIVSEDGLAIDTASSLFGFFDITGLLFGLGALALAEVFGYALAVQAERDALHEEQALTG